MVLGHTIKVRVLVRQRCRRARLRPRLRTAGDPGSAPGGGSSPHSALDGQSERRRRNLSRKQASLTALSVRPAPHPRTATTRWSSGDLTSFSARGRPVRSRHGVRVARPHRLMARISLFQGEGDGSEPSGATAGWRSSVPRGPHKPEPRVQIPYPPPDPVSFNGVTDTCPRSSAVERHHDKAERHVHLVPRVPRSCGETEITPDYESGGWGFDSLREHGDRSKAVAGPGREPGGRGFKSLRSPHP